MSNKRPWNFGKHIAAHTHLSHSGFYHCPYLSVVLITMSVLSTLLDPLTDILLDWRFVGVGVGTWFIGQVRQPMEYRTSKMLSMSLSRLFTMNSFHQSLNYRGYDHDSWANSYLYTICWLVILRNTYTPWANAMAKSSVWVRWHLIKSYSMLNPLLIGK